MLIEKLLWKIGVIDLLHYLYTEEVPRFYLLNLIGKDVLLMHALYQDRAVVFLLIVKADRSLNSILAPSATNQLSGSNINISELRVIAFGLVLRIVRRSI